MKKNKFSILSLFLLSSIVIAGNAVEALGQTSMPRSGGYNMKATSVSDDDQDQDYMEIERFVYQCLYQDDLANSPSKSGFYNRKMNHHFKRLEIKKPLDTGPIDGILHSKLMSRDLKTKMREATKVLNKNGRDNVRGKASAYLADYDSDYDKYYMEDVEDFLFPELQNNGKGMYFDITEVNISDGNADVLGDWSGECERHIYLVKENGRWRLDDIGLVDAGSYNWKERGTLKETLSEFIRNNQ